jgi:mannose-1-phosphate guanylyltransferase/mannose-1-phosphate guanylyltransferase/mannose-6-phosphate isomerase
MSPPDEGDAMLPVVLSGGHGTRLWPLSRAAVPKQFCDLFEESLLARTLRRLLPLGRPGLVGSAETEALTRRVFRELGIEARPALFEPRPRNTAPAVALLCRRLLQEGEGERIVGVFPADQLVTDEAAFLRAVGLATRCARDGRVVTLGIQPSRAETGFGYIEVSDEVVAAEVPPPTGGSPDDAPPLEARRVLAFREKPDAETAREYLETGRFLWNAGMFVFRASVMAGWFERLMPDLWAALEGLAPDLSNLEPIYEEIEAESLDYGIMERLDEQVSIACSIGWSDVGSWDEVARLTAERGSEPGVGASAKAAPPVFPVDAERNFVLPHPGRVYGLVGVDDLLVVDTADALLVARRGESQKVKGLVGELRRAGRPEATEHLFEVRPWGRFEILRDTEAFKSKVIEVDPGHRLSYQSHRHRSEHWVIVEGRPEVVLDDRVLTLAPGDHVFIPQGARHRIRNPTDERVVFVEVQLGTYFGEDDIERYEDDYHRI